MRIIIFFFLCFFSLQFYAQEQQLAYQYYRNGDYEKAISIYKKLHEQNPINTNYLNYLINSYQQTEAYEEVTVLIDANLKKYPKKQYLLIELGYNYQLQHSIEKATPYYDEALKTIEKTPSLGYIIGKTFQDNHLLDYALQAYEKAMELNPVANYNFQIARIYGEKGDIENMFKTYLNLIDANEQYEPSVKNYLGQFITDDNEDENNLKLKRLLLVRNQNNPTDSWNRLLSWLFTQQKEYNKALIQEKALYKRNPESLTSIINLGKIAFNDKDYSTSESSFKYILENTNELETELLSNLFLLQININTSNDYPLIESHFNELFSKYGKNKNTINIQAKYADFLAFKKNEPIKAITELKKSLKLPINDFQEGNLKIKLADILVFTNKFSSALINYTQVQLKLKNHLIGHKARFKIAQTSYFKGDFKWAQTQLKVLKNSTSQLISNDALDLNLLITDNAVKDSLKLALKTYAKADLLAFQNKNNLAIDVLSEILANYKGHPIEDESLFKQAQLFEKENQFELAEINYLKIIDLNEDDILADDSHYFLAELYLNQLNNTEKAKEYYQKIVFDYPSSIYLVDARKKFRMLRGDDIN